MKKLATLILLAVTTSFFAQKKFEGKAIYMSKTTMDMSRFGNKMTEQQKKQMTLRFKNFLEKTYTLTFNRSESSFKENVSLDAPGGFSGRSWGKSNGQGSIYKNVQDRKMIEDVEQFSKRFLVTEEMKQPEWELGTETKKIGQYTCYKATMTKVDTSVDWGSMFGRGRKNTAKKDSTKTDAKEAAPKERILSVTAWYTPQIPVSAGPDSYWGLPGLILELNAGRTTMLCTEITINPDDAIAIKTPTKGKKVNRDEYNKIVKEKTEEIRNQFKNRRRGGRKS
jgi:GLPGLI family protein